MKTLKRREPGFTLVEIMIVVAIIGLLAAIAIPNFIKPCATSQANSCISDFRQIDAAINEWALETGKSTGDFIPGIGTVSSYIKLNSTSSIPLVRRAALTASPAWVRCLKWNVPSPL